MDKRLEEMDIMLSSTLDDIESKLGLHAFRKVEPQIKALMKVSKDVGEYMMANRMNHGKTLFKGGKYEDGIG